MTANAIPALERPAYERTGTVTPAWTPSKPATA